MEMIVDSPSIPFRMSTLRCALSSPFSVRMIGKLIFWTKYSRISSRAGAVIRTHPCQTARDATTTTTGVSSHPRLSRGAGFA